ncbi:type II secretion system F family protein [Sandarakinorhabdus sp.]|uniref:type II secretion system F family protein n=1 Tax=Sandarakinorhabdus sp. TaxID=1916663 RepID=UPI0033401DEF
MPDGSILAGLPDFSALLPARQRRLAGRLAQFRPIGADVVPTRRAKRAQLPGLPGLVFVLDRLLGIDRSTAADEGISALPALLAGALAGALVFGCLNKLLGMSGAAAGGIAVAIAGFGGRYWVGARRDAMLARMEEQFALALGVIIRCVRAGLPVVEGMRAVAAEVPAPTGPELRRCVDQVQLGVDFDAALASLADRCPLADYRFFGVTVSLQRQTGGNLAETLDNLAETVRRRRAIRMKAQALTSETRATVAVLALLPVGVAGVMLLVSPEYILQLVNTDGGRRLLGIALVIQAFGLLVIRLISRKMLA